MPPVSKAQSRLMYAAAAGKVKGVPKSVGKDFTENLKKGSVKKLPEKVKPKKK